MLSGYDVLSDREQQVFRLLVQGNSTKEISHILNVSPKTAEKHRANIMKKLGIIKKELESGQLAKIKIGKPDYENDIGFAQAPDRRPSLAEKLFMELIAEIKWLRLYHKRISGEEKSKP
jgi:DNA-binding CsgD family transcriptional regulator